MDWLRRARADSDTTASSDPSLDESSGGTTLSDDCSRWVHRYPCLTPENCGSGQDVRRQSPADCHPRHDVVDDCRGADMTDDVFWIDELECRGSRSGEDPVMLEETEFPGTASDLSTSVVQPGNTTREPNSDSGKSGQRDDDSESSSGSEDIVLYDPKKRGTGAAQVIANSRARSMSFSTDATYGEDNLTNSKSLISTNPTLHTKVIRKESILKRLPSPIRHRILTHLLKASIPIVPSDMRSFYYRPHRIHSAILQTCRQFYTEGKTILYGQNTFRFETADSLFFWLVPDSTRLPPEALSTHAHHQIRHLELTAYTFLWFTTNLASNPPYPQLVLSESSGNYDDEGKVMTTIWDLRRIETLTIDFWVTQRRWDGFFNAFGPASGLHVLRRSGFRPRRVSVRTFGDMFEFPAGEIRRALMGDVEGGEEGRYLH